MHHESVVSVHSMRDSLPDSDQSCPATISMAANFAHFFKIYWKMLEIKLLLAMFLGSTFDADTV